MQPTLAPAPPHPLHTATPDHGFDQSLRDQLVAAASNPQSQQSSRIEGLHPTSSTGSRDHGNIDPAIAGAAMMTAAATSTDQHGGADDRSAGGDRRGARRELSTSKRAAQNRAAQRAFRQRKEGYIKKLEEQVRDYSMLSENYKALQAENYQLRDYIIALQSRLIESQGEVPQPPLNITLATPRGPDGLPRMPTSSEGMSNSMAAPMGPTTVSQLQASAAQAVADLTGAKHRTDSAAGYLTGGEYAPKRMRTDVPSVQQSHRVQQQGNAQLSMQAQVVQRQQQQQQQRQQAVVLNPNGTHTVS